MKTTSSDVAYAREKLHEATARCCRGETLVVGPSGLAEAVRRRGLAAAEPRGEASVPGELHRFLLSVEENRFRTVVLLGAVENADGFQVEALLEAAWRAVMPRGRLIVCVPNADWPDGDNGARAFSRRALKRLLKPLGRPRLRAEQPFRWLTMLVEKPGKKTERPPRSRGDRYRVTARLCRGKVLELGCGEGDLAAAIARRKHEVTGVELNAAKVRLARERYPAIRFIEGDICRLDLGGEQFDTVVIAEVLEHVPEAIGSRMLEKAWDALKPGGRLLVSVPNEDCVPHPNHVREFDRRALERLLAPLGRPRLAGDQPFRWLLMRVRKPA